MTFSKVQWEINIRLFVKPLNPDLKYVIKGRGMVRFTSRT